MRKLLLVIAVAALGLAACTGETDDGGVPSAAGGASPSAPADAAAQERAFVACMRQEGVADMPDPVPGDTSGRSAVRYALDVLGKGSDETFQTALAKCQPLLPTVTQTQPSGEELDVARKFAICMRDNGVSEFPDPAAGADMVFFADAATPDRVKVLDTGDIGVNTSDPAVRAAYDKCQSIFPGDQEP